MSAWVPILHVADARASCDFYCRKLGFTKNWEHQFEPTRPLFISVRRDNLELFFSEHRLDGCREGQLYLYVDDIDAFHRQAVSNGLAVDPPRQKDWGVKEIEFQDPDGYRFRIGERTSAR